MRVLALLLCFFASNAFGLEIIINGLFPPRE
jgi:hypothetical protein